MNKIVDPIRKTIRGLMHEVAVLLDDMTNGHIRPNHITVISFLGHMLVALAIVNNQLEQAALLLVVFGLLDAVDGALARIQKSSTSAGAFYDSISDRVKEVIVYLGISFWLVEYDTLNASVLAVAALGGSMTMSYLKSRGETLILESNSKTTSKAAKETLSSGFMRFEIRMLALAITLLTGYVVEGLYVIVVLTWLSAGYSFIRISEFLKKHK